MTTTTWKELAQPEKTAGQIALETNWVEITDGTEKQIKFANDLRSQWIADVTHHANIANVRYAVVEQIQNDVDLTSPVNRTSKKLDYSYLANDAYNRRAVKMLNTNNAKAIIDFFKDIKAQSNRSDAISRYDHIIRYPEKWHYDGKKWVRINWK